MPRPRSRAPSIVYQGVSYDQRTLDINYEIENASRQSFTGYVHVNVYASSAGNTADIWSLVDQNYSVTVLAGVKQQFHHSFQIYGGGIDKPRFIWGLVTLYAQGGTQVGEFFKYLGELHP